MLTPAADDVFSTMFAYKEHKERCNETATKKDIKLVRMKQVVREFLAETL